MYQDKSGMFEDFGFKLVVVNTLLDEEASFTDELEKMEETYVDEFEPDDDHLFDCIPEMVSYFENLELTEDDLGLVTQLIFDGGIDVYPLIMPYWDGEDDFFDVKSVKGFEKLPNLQKVLYNSMCDEGLLDEFKEAGIRVN